MEEDEKKTNKTREELIESILKGARRNPDFREVLTKRANQAQINKTKT